MTASEASLRPPESFRKASRIAAATAMAIGVLVLAGWLFRLRVLMQVSPGLVAMAPNGAVGFVLTGFSLWLQAGKGGGRSLRASRAAAAAAGLLGLLTVGEYLLKVDLGLDTLLFRDTEGLTGPFPCRMAFAAGLGFSLLGAALVLTSLSRARVLAESLAAIAGLIALVSLEGYVYGVRGLYAIGFYRGIALHAALAFLALSIGVLLVRDDFRFSSLIASDTAGGVVARWSLPIALGIPLLLGWLRLAGERAGLWGTDFGRALLSVATTVFLIAALLGIAATLKRGEEQRRQADDALRRAERHARSLIEASLDPLVTISPDGRVSDVNEATIQATGLPRETLVGSRFSDYFTEPDKAEAGYKLVFAEGVVRDYPLTLRHVSGRTIHVLYNATLFRDDSGAIQGVFAAARDITAQKRLEKELQSCEAYLVEGQRLSHTGSWAWKVATGEVFWSQEMFRLFGLHPGETKPSFELFLRMLHPTDRPRVEQEIDRAVRDCMDFESRYRIVQGGGSIRYLHSLGRPVLDERGQVAEFVGVGIDVTARTVAEEALARSEERHRLILSNVDEIVYVVGMETGNPLESRVQFVSEGVERVAGYPVDDFLRDPGLWLRAVHPDDLSAVEQATRRILESGVSGTREYRLRHRKTGAYLWIEDHVIPRLDDSGRPVAILGVARDVTERKRAEEALRESEERFREIANAIYDVFWAADVDITKTSYVSPAYERIWGRSVASLYENPRSFLDAVHPGDRAQVLAGLEVQKSGQPFRHEYRILRPDGTERWISDAGFPVREPTGEVRRCVGIARDITEQKRADEALEKSEARYRMLMEQASDGIFVIDQRGRYLAANPKACEMLGYTLDELRVLNVSDVLAPEDLAETPLRFDELRARKTLLVERRLRRKDGTVFPVEISAKMLDDGTFQGIARDITERKRAEEELKASRGRLLALSRRLIEVQEAERRHVARELHDEIGQALTALKINLQAAHHPGGDAELASRLEDSLGIVERAIQQVRDMSLALRPSLLDDLGLVAALRWHVDRQAQRSGFEARLEAEPARIRVSPEVEIGCYRIVQEALNNVARHAQARNVRVEVALREGELRLLIQDDGVGFDVKAARERASRGASMGLLTMSERARLFGGRLKMKSAPGKGTEIRAVFPASPAR